MRVRQRCPPSPRLRRAAFVLAALGGGWWGLRGWRPPEIFPARGGTTLRSARAPLWCGRGVGSRAARSGLRAPPSAARSHCCAPAPPFADSKSAVLLTRRHRNESGQGDRTCTCMISLPRGVADCLAPHPDLEIEPARRRAHSGPVLVSVLA